MFVASLMTAAASVSLGKRIYRLEDFPVPDFRVDAEKHAIEQSPKEACGVVMNGCYWRCRNIADNPEQDFVLNPCDYAIAALYGQIEAIVHSHPQGGPASEADLASCKQTNLPWFIYSVPSQEWSTINP